MQQLVILGGGFAGLWAALVAAREALVADRPLAITLVAPDDALTVRPRLYEPFSPAFRAALRDVLELATTRRVALMCAEADFRHCHRQLIADSLVLAGAEVRHISAPDNAAPHEFHPALCAARNPPVYNAGLSGDLFD